MDLSPQNKHFLDVLHKLGIDAKDFPDKTFDGLFENVPDSMNYFFHWFMENITSENVLTPSEQAIYFQLESNRMLPTQEEMDCIFASYNPTYEELLSLDPNYVKILLPRDLIDLSGHSEKLNEISSELESNYFTIKEMHKSVKEESNVLKKQLLTARQECDSVNVLFSDKLEEAKEVLLKEPQIKIDFDLYKIHLEMENNVFDQVKDLTTFRDDFYEPSELILSEMKEDLAYMETSLVFTQGFLKAKKKEIEVLSEWLYKKSPQESFNETLMKSQAIQHEEISKIIDDTKILESELHEKLSKIGQNKVDKIIQECFLEKTGVCELYMAQLNKCKNCIKYRNKLDEALLHIINKTISNLGNSSCMRENVYSKIEEFERNFSNNISNLELQSKRFKEVCMQQQRHPFLLAVKEIINIDGNFAKSAETLSNVMELMTYISDDAKFVLQNLRNKLQASIKNFFDNTLCGPTSEVLFTPVELSIKLQECVEYERKLSHSIKQLASAYMEAKDFISKSDRKSLLLWIKFLTMLSASKKN